MNPNKICFIYCVNQEEQLQQSLRSISFLDIPEGFVLEAQAVDDAKSMTAGYNEAMMHTDAKYKVYLHQDVQIMHKSFLVDAVKLFRANPQLGMLGMAGASYVPLNGIWWEAAEKYGQVYCIPSGVVELLAFRECGNGLDYQPVAAVDGLLMMTQVDIPWRDDLFRGWHFYDLSQCFEFARAGYEIGVPRQATPWTLHDCGIPVLNNGFPEDRERFVNEYRGELISGLDAYVTDRVRAGAFRDLDFAELSVVGKHMLEQEMLSLTENGSGFSAAGYGP